jgi:pyruvate dehydrogenase E1 component alpha subunit
MCFLGDGAVNQGAFHESLNLAALFDIPVIYIIENNGYSMGTSQSALKLTPSAHGLAQRAEGYDMRWDTVHGENLYEVRAKVKEAIDHCYNDHRPSILEIFTYRYYGHSIADANHHRYRTKEEIKSYQENKDPIEVWKRILKHEGVLDDDAAKEIDNAAKEEAKSAVKFADDSPFPPAEELLTDVYSTVDEPGSSDNEGTIFFNDRLPWDDEYKA